MLATIFPDLLRRCNSQARAYQWTRRGHAELRVYQPPQRSALKTAQTARCSSMVEPVQDHMHQIMCCTFISTKQFPSLPNCSSDLRVDGELLKVLVIYPRRCDIVLVTMVGANKSLLGQSLTTPRPERYGIYQFWGNQLLSFVLSICKMHTLRANRRRQMLSADPHGDSGLQVFGQTTSLLACFGDSSQCAFFNTP